MLRLKGRSAGTGPTKVTGDARAGRPPASSDSRMRGGLRPPSRLDHRKSPGVRWSGTVVARLSAGRERGRDGELRRRSPRRSPGPLRSTGVPRRSGGRRSVARASPDAVRETQGDLRGRLANHLEVPQDRIEHSASATNDRQTPGLTTCATVTGPVLLKTVPRSLGIASFLKKGPGLPDPRRPPGDRVQRANEPAAGGVMP